MLRWAMVGTASVAMNLVGWGLLGHHLGRPAEGADRAPVEVSLAQSPPPPKPRLRSPIPPPPPPPVRRVVVPPPRRCDPPPRPRRLAPPPQPRRPRRTPPRVRPRQAPEPPPPRREEPKPPDKKKIRESPTPARATAALTETPEGDRPREATDREGPSRPAAAGPRRRSGRAPHPAVRTRPTPSPARPTVDLGRLKSRIHAAIARHRHYPRLARRRGLEGTVVLAFRISKAGRITDLRVVQSAGALLDDAARAAVRKAGRLPPYGEIIRLPVRFRLED